MGSSTSPFEWAYFRGRVSPAYWWTWTFHHPPPWFPGTILPSQDGQKLHLRIQFGSYEFDNPMDTFHRCRSIDCRGDWARKGAQGAYFLSKGPTLTSPHQTQLGSPRQRYSKQSISPQVTSLSSTCYEELDENDRLSVVAGSSRMDIDEHDTFSSCHTPPLRFQWPPPSTKTSLRLNCEAKFGHASLETPRTPSRGVDLSTGYVFVREKWIRSCLFPRLQQPPISTSLHLSHARLTVPKIIKNTFWVWRWVRIRYIYICTHQMGRLATLRTPIRPCKRSQRLLR